MFRSMSDRLLAGATQQMTVTQRGPADSLVASLAALRAIKWARHLPETDQCLLALDQTGRHSCRKIAELVGMHPGTVVRRLKRLRGMLKDPVVVALMDDPAELSVEYRQIGVARWLHRRPLTWIARQFGLTRTEVATILKLLEDWPALRKRKQQA